MSKLGNLIGKSKTFTIGGTELELKPRTFADMDLFLELSKEDKRVSALKELIKKTLKEAVPDATDEEIEKIGIQYFKELSEAIVSVNGLNANQISA
jgi:hypothetical protein